MTKKLSTAASRRRNDHSIPALSRQHRFTCRRLASIFLNTLPEQAHVYTQYGTVFS